MNGENKPNGWLIAIKVAISAVIAIALYALGSYFGATIANLDIIYAIVILALIVFIAGNAIAAAVFKKRMDKLKVRAAVEAGEKRRILMQENPESQKRKLGVVCAIAILYSVVLVLLTGALCFFGGALRDSSTGAVIFGTYLFYGIVDRLLVFHPKQKFDDALSEYEYPELYAMAREVSGRGDGAPLYIYLHFPGTDHECSASVSFDEKTVCLFLGPVLLNVLSKEEMRQVMAHEFAHVGSNHSGDIRFVSKLLAFLAGNDESYWGFWMSFSLKFPLYLVGYEAEYYFFFSSVQSEKQADEMAATHGAVTEQAGALAKIHAFGLYTYERRPYDNFYKWESVPENFATMRTEGFREALNAREAQWRILLENEIPSRNASHPTFKQRWEAIGCCDYSLTPASGEGAYYEECRKALVEADKMVVEAISEQYAQGRKENFEAHLEAVSAYEAGNVTFSPDQLRSVIYGYYCLGRPADAEAICDKIIDKYGDSAATAFARYWKGTILLYRYDKAGLSYLYESMDLNRNFIEEGLSLIGQFCTKMGLQTELDEYRARAIDYMQTSRDFGAGGIHAKAKLSPEALPDGWLEKILGYISQIDEGAIEKVYLVHEVASEGYEPSSFVLRFADGTDDAVAEKVYGQVFNLLDDWPENWEFCLYVYDQTMERPLNQVSGSCVFDKKTS